MQFTNFSFGSLQIDGNTYDRDVVIDRGEIRKRRKAPSKQFRDDFGHTPLSVQESVPWKCLRLVIGTGAYGKLPVMDEVRRAAERHKIELLVLPTDQAIEILNGEPETTNAILHLTAKASSRAPFACIFSCVIPFLDRKTIPTFTFSVRALASCVTLCGMFTTSKPHYQRPFCPRKEC
jgi:hypothetical protein